MKYFRFLILFLIINPTFLLGQEIIVDTISHKHDSISPVRYFPNDKCETIETITINNKEYSDIKAFEFVQDYFFSQVRKNNSITMYLFIDATLGLQKVIIEKIKYPEDLPKLIEKLKKIKINPKKQKCYKGNWPEEIKWYESPISFTWPVKLN